MSSHFFNPTAAAVGDDGFLPGAKLYAYQAGTNTPLDTYSDDALTTPNTNPILADADGNFGPIYCKEQLYKFVLKDASDVAVRTNDNYQPPINWSGSTTISSSSTTSIGAAKSRYVVISGTTTITSLGAGTQGLERTVRFSGALTLTHNGTALILPGAANITTEAGDIAEFVSEGSSNWRMLSYQRASGLSESSGFENVLDYGADATGTNDSSAAFQAAQVAADAAGGSGVVFVPSGTYKITSVDAGACMWLGAGRRLVTIKCYTNNTNMFDDADQGATFDSLGFDGQKATMTTGTPIICDAPDITVRNCFFKDTPEAAVLQGNITSTRWRFLNNSCENCGTAGWPALPFVSGDYNEADGNVIVCTDGGCAYGVGIEPNNGNPQVRYTRITNNTLKGCNIALDAANVVATHYAIGAIVANNYVDTTGSYGADNDFESGAPLYVRNMQDVMVTGNIFIADPDCHYQAATIHKAKRLIITGNIFEIDCPASGTSYAFKFTVLSSGKSEQCVIDDNTIINLDTVIPTWLCDATGTNVTSVIFGTQKTYGSVVGTGSVVVPNDASEDRYTRVDTQRYFSDRFSITPGTINTGVTYESGNITVGGDLGDFVWVAPITAASGGTWNSLRITAQFVATNTIRIFITNTSGGNISVNGGGAVDFRAKVERYTAIAGGTSTEV